LVFYSIYILYKGGVFIRCLKGELILNKGSINNFKKIITRQEIISFSRHIIKLIERSHSEILNREVPFRGIIICCLVGRSRNKARNIIIIMIMRLVTVTATMTVIVRERRRGCPRLRKWYRNLIILNNSI
jgi:hypothetical protein